MLAIKLGSLYILIYLSFLRLSVLPLKMFFINITISQHNIEGSDAYSQLHINNKKLKEEKWKLGKWHYLGERERTVILACVTLSSDLSIQFNITVLQKPSFAIWTTHQALVFKSSMEENMHAECMKYVHFKKK